MELIDDPQGPKTTFLKSNTEYKHFESSVACDLFIINNKHLSILKKCCGGRGCEIKIDLTYKTRIPKEIEIQTKGTCEICFLDNKSLFKKCFQCKNTLCEECLEKLPSKICPYCRGPLKM
jgi:hypothetical protein